MLTVLVFGFTTYYIQVIPKTIAADINRVLDKRPWIQEFVAVDGRHVYLRGEIEPDSGLEAEIAAIASVAGVKKVITVLDEIPRPSVHLKLQVLGDRVLVGGHLSGDLLEPIISYLESSFPDRPLQDSIKIDDRLGRPLWIEGFSHSLQQLALLDNFELNGWRDQIEITGIADSELLRLQVGYGVPASLNSQVKVTNRLKLKASDKFASISLVSDWRGSSISGVVPSIEIREKLLDAVLSAFGADQIESALVVNETLVGSDQLLLLSELLPSLGQARDLRLESTAEGFIVWGRVDDPLSLGRILQARNDLGLEGVVQSEIVVAEADNPASLTLFSDQQRVILNGTLPTNKSKQQLIADIKEILGVHNVVDLASIEPNIAHSDWLGKWSALLAGVPRSVIGITIDDESLLITGVVESASELTTIDQQLRILFPDTNRLNWITATNE